MSTKPGSNPDTFSLVPKVINGGIAGIIGVACVFPLDLVKTRLQNQPIGPQGEKMYKSMFDCFMKTYRAEGFGGMYKGAGINAILCTPEKAIKLAANDFFRYHLRKSDGTLPMIYQMIAGGLAGGAQTIVTTPMELLKIQMQDAGRAAAAAKAGGQSVEKQSSTTEVIMTLLKNRGLRGFYEGGGTTIFRDVSFAVIYFPMFFFLNEFGPRKEEGQREAAFWVSFCAGYTAAALSAVTVTPMDVVKTRLQAQVMAKVGTPVQFTGFLDCVRKTYKHEGILAFYKGGACRVIVISPLFGIIQMVYYLGVAEYLLGYPRHY